MAPFFLRLHWKLCSCGYCGRIASSLKSLTSTTSAHRLRRDFSLNDCDDVLQPNRGLSCPMAKTKNAPLWILSFLCCHHGCLSSGRYAQSRRGQGSFLGDDYTHAAQVGTSEICTPYSLYPQVMSTGMSCSSLIPFAKSQSLVWVLVLPIFTNFYLSSGTLLLYMPSLQLPQLREARNDVCQICC